MNVSRITLFQGNGKFGKRLEMVLEKLKIHQNKNQLTFRLRVENLTVFSNTVTAACPYPALRLDKLYAALIRCLVLWTITKQFLVFRVLKDCIF